MCHPGSSWRGVEDDLQALVPRRRASAASEPPGRPGVRAEDVQQDRVHMRAHAWPRRAGVEQS
eukprot:4910688-Heterocapsa_arctica.AAC.1